MNDLHEELRRLHSVEQELERKRMRLVACGVVAMADTPESAASARQMHPDYESAACSDVARRVDECIRLRAINAQLLEALEDCVEAFEVATNSGGVNFYEYMTTARAAIAAAKGEA